MCRSEMTCTSSATLNAFTVHVDRSTGPHVLTSCLFRPDIAFVCCLIPHKGRSDNRPFGRYAARPRRQYLLGGGYTGLLSRYFDEGASMTSKVCLIHGMSVSSWCWDNYLPLLRERGYDCIAPALPFHGKVTGQLLHVIDNGTGSPQIVRQFTRS